MRHAAGVCDVTRASSRLGGRQGGRRGALRRAWFGAMATLLAPLPIAGQLADEVSGADGTVRFGYDTRPGVEICERGVRIGERQMRWRSGRGDEEPMRCTAGFAEVELEVRDGRVYSVDLVNGARDADPNALDLGTVDPDEAVDFLLGLPYGEASSDAAEDAILPAMLADVPEAWRPLLGLARDRGVRDGVRKSALFWLGQEAAEMAGRGLSDVAMDEDEDQDVRDAAIFALSQRPPDEAVPALIEVARSGGEPDTRRTAMFWLAQSEDERVVDFFEEVLLGRIR